MTDKEINGYRAETPGCINRIHLNSAGASLMPLPVIDAIQNYMKREAEIGGYEAAHEHTNEISEFYSVAADFLGCNPKNVAFAANWTVALNHFSLTRGAEWVLDNVYYVQKKDSTRFGDWEFANALMLGTTEAIQYAKKIGP